MSPIFDEEPIKLVPFGTLMVDQMLKSKYRKTFCIIALIALVICVFFITSRNSELLNNGGNHEESVTSSELTIQGGDDARSTRHNSDVVKNSPLNKQRRHLAAVKESLKGDEDLAVHTKVNAVITPGEVLVTLDYYEPEDKWLITAMESGLQAVDDESEGVTMKTYFFTVKSDFIEANDMSNFIESQVDGEYQYAEAWALEEYHRMLHSARSAKGSDIGLVSQMLFTAEENERTTIHKKANGEGAMSIHTQSELQANGELHIISDLKISN